MTASYCTIRDLTNRLGMSKDQLRGFIRRGDLHVERDGPAGRALRIPRPEAEAFVRFVESARASAPDPDRPRGMYCQDAPGRCICRCHRVRAAKDRRRAFGGHGRAWNSWLASHDDALRQLVAACTPPWEIAEALSARFSVPRTAHAVKLRIKQLGLSTRDGWVSGEDLIRGLGLYRRRVGQFEAQGLLTPAEYGRWRRYSLAEVAALVKAQAGLTIDPRRVRDPRFKAIAETAAVANRRRQAS